METYEVHEILANLFSKLSAAEYRFVVCRYGITYHHHTFFPRFNRGRCDTHRSSFTSGKAASCLEKYVVWSTGVKKPGKMSRRTGRSDMTDYQSMWKSS